ncbi:hypothetical protein OG21DRAFT_1516057 [Imleria badia]|nr:hypothetical protein OG21DRAFT_1516057 [Imleria badia]
MPATNNLYWSRSTASRPFWDWSASDILNEQALEESIQKSVGALLMPTENTMRWPPWGWYKSTSEILGEQAAEEAQY